MRRVMYKVLFKLSHTLIKHPDKFLVPAIVHPSSYSLHPYCVLSYARSWLDLRFRISEFKSCVISVNGSALSACPIISTGTPSDRLAFRALPCPRKCSPSKSALCSPVALAVGDVGVKPSACVFAALDVRRRRVMSAYELRWLRGFDASVLPSAEGTMRLS